MFDSTRTPEREPSCAALGVDDLHAWQGLLGALDRGVDDAARIDQLRALEELKAGICAAQARVTVDFAASQRAELAAAGVDPAEASRGIGAQVALARRESPHAGNRLLGIAKALVGEMPHTMAALAAGRLNEYRAFIMVRETACLSREDRAVVDEQVAGSAEAVSRLGNRRVEVEARKAAYRVDPRSVVDRAAKAPSERRVSMRPAPDTMVWLTALLPVKEGVAAYAALGRAADQAKAAGDPRGRGQVMADTLVERVTGRAAAEGVPVQVNLVMTDRALLGKDDEPGFLPGYGVVPAETARGLVRGAALADSAVRRLFTHPASGQLVAIESVARAFPAGLARFVRLRDHGTCRTPWCDAPVRHIDHVVAHTEGGETGLANAQGLCVACNQTKRTPGWDADPCMGPEARHRVTTTTPTGHRYVSDAQPPPGARDPATRIDILFRDLHLAA